MVRKQRLHLDTLDDEVDQAPPPLPGFFLPPGAFTMPLSLPLLGTRDILYFTVYLVPSLSKFR